MAWSNNRGKGEHVLTAGHEIDEGRDVITLFSPAGADLFTYDIADAILLRDSLNRAIEKYQATSKGTP